MQCNKNGWKRKKKKKKNARKEYNVTGENEEISEAFEKMQMKHQTESSLNYRILKRFARIQVKKKTKKKKNEKNST